MTTHDIEPAALRDDNRVEFCRTDRLKSDKSRKSSLVWRKGHSTPTPPTPPGPGGIATDEVEDYVTFITQLLEAEEKRYAAMETRALAVVTSSGALVTLLLGVAALVTRVQQVQVPRQALLFAALSVVAFLFAAGPAILALSPRRVWGVTPDKLRTELWARWGSAGDDPRQKTTATRLAIWESAHKLSQRKGRLVFAAMVAQAVAVTLLGVAVVIVLASG
jgi:hypothetical protein